MTENTSTSTHKRISEWEDRRESLLRELAEQDRVFLDEVARELAGARGKHAPINSAHEGYAVILEELDEFWEEVRRRRADRDPKAMRLELIQIAAMATRTAVDCSLRWEEQG